MSSGPANPIITRALLIVVTVWCALSSPEHILAQSDALAIKKQASPDPVVAGEELTYTITLRNLADTPQQDVVVLDRLPDQVRVLYYGVQGEGRWIAGVKDERRVVMWIAQEPLSPGTEVTFTIVVQVEQSAYGTLVNDDYGVGVGKAEIALRGTAVRTGVIVPTPSPTLPPTPTSIPSPTPVRRQVTVTPAGHTLPSATPSPPTVEPTQMPPEPSPTIRAKPAPVTHPWAPIMVAGGSILLIFVVVMAGHFLRKRG